MHQKILVIISILFTTQAHSEDIGDLMSAELGGAGGNVMTKVGLMSESGTIPADFPKDTDKLKKKEDENNLKARRYKRRREKVVKQPLLRQPSDTGEGKIQGIDTNENKSLSDKEIERIKAELEKKKTDTSLVLETMTKLY